MPFDSFRNWQSRAIDQKQNVSSLLLGLSGAALGFSVSMLSGQQTYMGKAQSVVFHLHSIVQLGSMAAGIAFSLNRVRDFDLTSQIARLREKTPGSPSLASKRDKVRRLGRMTRRLYYAQAISFGVGALAFMAFALLRFGNVLYSA